MKDQNNSQSVHCSTVLQPYKTSQHKTKFTLSLLQRPLER